MSQPPEGGYPPPSQGQPGYAGPPQGYPPGQQPGPQPGPAGYQPGYQPPPGYQPGYPPQPGYQQPQGFQQQGYQQQGFQQQPPGKPPKKKPSAGQRVVGILILVVALLAFFLVIDKNFRNNVLDAVGLKDGIGGGSGSSAPDIAQISWPKTLPGGYYAVESAPAWHDTRAKKYKWVTAEFYANKPPASRGTPGSYLYTVTAYGPLAELDEAFLGVKAPIEEVAGGSCYSSDERARDCAVTNGKIVVMVGTAWTSATKRPRTDAQMVQDGKKFADALTQGQ
jgi:hypothetical protein